MPILLCVFVLKTHTEWIFPNLHFFVTPLKQTLPLEAKKEEKERKRKKNKKSKKKSKKRHKN